MSKRFVYRPLDSDQMKAIGDNVISGIKLRLSKGINGNDAPAKPLSKNYAKGKQRYGLNPIRDFIGFRRGLTISAMKVVRSTANQVAIGFDNPQASRIAAINNKIDPLFWFSPDDQKLIQGSVQDQLQKGSNLNTGGK